MIPISLIITLEIVKIVQGLFIAVDTDGYSHIREKFIKAGSVSLNEELGQVNFLFSDKTGTLTCNKMEYKYGVIGDVCYDFIRNNGNNEENVCFRQENHIIPFGPESFSPNKFASKSNSRYPDFEVVSEHNSKVKLVLDTESSVVDEYWKALAICHGCEIEVKENGENEYISLSPDDIELVKTAATQGYQLKISPSSTIRRVAIGGVEKDFEVLNVLDFNYTRKRMSVIIRDGELIKLYIKGADSAVEWIEFEKNISRISPNSKKEFLSQAKQYVEFFSTKGYRTLILGMKVLDENEYNQWSKKFNEANLNLQNKQKALDDVYAEVEKNIYVLGATIVEDKLQDGVPETIRDLRLAGIKIWMLTGDKMDTAYNIGLSCNLIYSEHKIFKLCGEKGDKLKKLVNEFDAFKRQLISGVDENKKKLSPYSIVVDAVALSLILSSEESTKTFLDIGYDAVSVICCRVSPLQKSDVVRIIKEYDKNAVTSAIGDGGNDVAMIMEAHIGNI
jgi:phospholipid-transporting ATPase